MGCGGGDAVPLTRSWYKYRGVRAGVTVRAHVGVCWLNVWVVPLSLLCEILSASMYVCMWRREERRVCLCVCETERWRERDKLRGKMIGVKGDKLTKKE